MTLSTALAAEKWHAVANASGLTSTRSSSFYLTAAGVGIGQVLPPQMALAAVRGIGARLNRGSALMGLGTSIVEQAFDVVLFGILLVASAATYCVGGGGGVWLAFAVVGLGAGWLGITYAARVWTRTGNPRRMRRSRILRRLDAVLDLLATRSGVAQYLFLISGARYGVLVLLLMAIGLALHIPISPWQIAASLPFPMLVAGLIPTPGGLGANEWTMAAALAAFGVPLEAALPWVIGSRILSFAGGLAVAAIGAAIAAVSHRALLARSLQEGTCRGRATKLGAIPIEGTSRPRCPRAH
jgi:uncharacterized membrane protein YbhN (UPF0104 family)